LYAEDSVSKEAKKPMESPPSAASVSASDHVSESEEQISELGKPAGKASLAALRRTSFSFSRKNKAITPS